MGRQIEESLAKERMVAATSAFFSVLGLLLASIGIFGVASTVAQRPMSSGSEWRSAPSMVGHPRVVARDAAGVRRRADGRRHRRHRCRQA
jgi:hypothetical protein